MVATIDIPRSAKNEDVENISDILCKDSVVDVEIPMRGLLVKESIVVSSCSQNHLEAQSSNISHFCTGTYNYPLFIKIKGSNRIVIGRLADLLLYTGKLRLNDLRVLRQDWIERKSERVQPKQPTFITLLGAKKQIRANLFDISKTGMGVLIDRSIEDEVKSIANEDIQVMMRVPPKNSISKIPAQIVQINPVSSDLIRIGLLTYPTKMDDKVLDKYLTERKREILDEVFTNFKEMLSFRETKDLYF